MRLLDTLFSLTLIDTYHSKIVPIGLTNPLKAITIMQSLKAFINDVVLHVADGPLAPFPKLVQHASEQVQWWDQLVKVTGSSSNTKKCCTIAYKWTPDPHSILQLTVTKTPRDPIISTADNSSPPI